MLSNLLKNIPNFFCSTLLGRGIIAFFKSEILMLLNVLPVTLFRIYDKTQSAWIVWNAYNGSTIALLGRKVNTDSFIFQFLGLLSMR